ncbi:MAG TPA: methionyl-tRNA formyltransferase [Sandaracinaceae bacterium]
MRPAEQLAAAGGRRGRPAPDADERTGIGDRVRPGAKRVLYFGLPLGALCLIADGHVLAGACISRPDQPGMRRLRARMAGALLLEKPDLSDPAVVARLRALAPDLIVSWFWTRQIPEEVIALAPFAFNVHPSLLPRHRGADPYFWAIASGDRETGVTAHLLTARYDEGPILAQRSVPIPEDANAWRLARILDRPSLALMREIAARAASGERLETVPQDEARATLAPEPSAEDCELRWSWPVDVVLARVRAAAPWPGAFTEYAGRVIVVTRAARAGAPPELAPGQAARDAHGVIVRAADGAVRLLEARFEEEDELFRGPSVARLFPGLPAI